MRLTCPHCGERELGEYTYRGDAAPERPALRPRGRAEPSPTHDVAMFEYVHIRTNAPGVMTELWQHSGGCRAWLRVDRDITTHAVGRIRPARDAVITESAR